MRTSRTSAYQEMMINSKFLEVPHQQQVSGSPPWQLPAGAEHPPGAQDRSSV